MDFGTRLRSAREERGITLRQIALNTKISIGALEALERNDASRLPGGIFSRSFVRAYALEVGLDPEVTVTEFIAAFPEHGMSDAAEVSSPSVVDEGRPHVGLVAVVTFALVALGGFSSWQWWQRRNAAPPSVTPVTVAATPSPTAAPTADISPVHTAPSVASPAEERAPAAASVEPPAVAPAPPLPPGTAETPAAGLRMSVHPREACWVRITVAGRVRVSRVMQAGEREEIATNGTVLLEVGNAAAFDYTINGARGRSLGAAGQVVRATIEQDNLDRYIAR